MPDPIATRSDAPAWVVEPRGPHLPDVVTRVPFLVWPFVVLSVLAAWSWWDRVNLNGLESLDVVRWAISSSPSVLAPLVGAALFLRHPNALRSLPMLAAGATLLGVTAVLDLVDPWLIDVLRTLTPPADDAILLDGLATWYGFLAPLVLIFAVIYLARGLSSARLFEDVGSSRWLRVTAGVLVGGILLFYVRTLVSLGASDQSDYLVVSIAAAVISVAEIIAWAYLTATALAGRRAGEDPATGWSLAAAAGMAFLSATLITYGLLIAATALGGFWEVGTFAGDASYALLSLASLGLALASVLLIAAFVIGLPAEDAQEDPAGDDLARDAAPPPGPVADSV